MDLPPANYRSRFWSGREWVLSASAALVAAAAVFSVGLPYPADKANILASVWTVIALGSFAVLAVTRAAYPRGNLLVAASVFSLFGAAYSILIQETFFYSAKIAADSPLNITHDQASYWSDFLISVANSGLLASCWAFVLELHYPRRGAAATAVIILTILILLALVIRSK